jgi:hypothetical protein
MEVRRHLFDPSNLPWVVSQCPFDPYRAGAKVYRARAGAARAPPPPPPPPPPARPIDNPEGTYQLLSVARATVWHPKVGHHAMQPH